VCDREGHYGELESKCFAFCKARIERVVEEFPE
jgi:hypothetical protein